MVRGYDDQGDSEIVCFQILRKIEHGPGDRFPLDELGELQTLQSTIVLCEVVIRFDEHGGVVALDRELGSVHHQLEVGTDAGSLFGRTQRISHKWSDNSRGAGLLLEQSTAWIPMTRNRVVTLVTHRNLLPTLLAHSISTLDGITQVEDCHFFAVRCQFGVRPREIGKDLGSKAISSVHKVN